MPKPSPPRCPKGVAPAIRKRFGEIVANMPADQLNHVDSAQILALAALEVAIPVLIEAGDLSELDKATQATARLRRTLGISKTQTTTQAQRGKVRPRTPEHPQVPDAAARGDSKKGSDWVRERWRAELPN